MIDLMNLHAPFPPNEIEWRVGSTTGDKTKGLALAYLTARHIMERLDEVCGAENWQDRYEFHGTRTICYLSLRIGDEWITKADGAGDSDVEAEKGAISDALKRAAVKWGIGRYLYQMTNTWVEIEAYGKSFRIKAAEYPRLEGILFKNFGMPPSDMNVRTEAPPDFTASQPKAQSRELFTTVMQGVREAGGKGKADLRAYWTSEAFVEAWEAFPADWRDELTAEKEGFLASYPKPTGRVDPNESLDRQFADTVGK